MSTLALLAMEFSETVGAMGHDCLRQRCGLVRVLDQASTCFLGFCVTRATPVLARTTTSVVLKHTNGSQRQASR